ncbi:hypothetical protein FQA47_022301 [Oryzias melastigma]|uniref:Uncharacterized protein n=1 Tax=Oryzias melastigma TaxID=30732 RepID=A0A834FIW0_ORYME|nr:hypothetical protein FQA47_022301 [Oryzias melastigma]
MRAVETTGGAPASGGSFDRDVNVDEARQPVGDDGGAARALQPAGGRKMPHRVTADATSSHAPECDAGKVGLVPTVESGCEPLQTVREVQTSADERCRTRKKTHVYLKEAS